jgi:hypothetical protein
MNEGIKPIDETFWCKHVWKASKHRRCNFASSSSCASGMQTPETNFESTQAAFSADTRNSSVIAAAILEKQS